MQKFRDYIYVDNNKVESFINQISDFKKNLKYENSESQTNINGTLGPKTAKLVSNINKTKAENYEYRDSSIEKIINWVQKEKNAINYSGEHLDNNNKDNLIVINGIMTIPEMSENLEILNSLSKQSALLNIIPISIEDKEKISLIGDSNTIPIILENDSDYLFNCSLQKKNIIGSIQDFMDNVDEEMTIVGRIDKIYNSDEEIEIFNLAKETFKLNRAATRKMNKEDMKSMIVTETGPLIKITPLIIYK